MFTIPLFLRPLAFCLPLAGVAANETPQVRVVSPQTATEAQAYEIPGRTEPLEAATLFTRATGIIRERNFDIGDPVKAGEVLAVIDAPDIDKAVEAARAALDEASARAKVAESLAGRSNVLLETNAISREEGEQRLADHASATAALRAAEAALGRLEEQQRFATVRAPFDGVIAARNFDRGDRVRGDSATSEGWLYRLVRLDTLRFIVNATPDFAFRLSPETTAQVRFTELPGRPFTAKVSRSSRVFDTASGTMRVEFLLENADLALPAGLTGAASFELAPPTGTFLLPGNTLVLRAGKTSVAIVTDGKVKFIDVLPGRNLGNLVEVTSAELSPESPVIVNPNALLRSGDAVTIAAN